MKSSLFIVFFLFSSIAFAGKSKNQQQAAPDMMSFHRSTHKVAILITSYVPFWGRSRNNSQLTGNLIAQNAEKALGEEIGVYHCPLSVTTKAFQEAMACMAQIPVPVAMVISMGESNDCNQKSLRLELGAKNYANIWDYKGGNGGDSQTIVTEHNGPIWPGGPSYVPAKMPFEKMYCGVAPQSRNGIEFHSDPGQYICNYTQYQMSAELSHSQPQTMHGFMHVLNSQCDKRGSSVSFASQAILEMIRGALSGVASDETCKFKALME